MAVADSATPVKPKQDIGPCATEFKLCQLKEGEKDKLGHKVQEIFWMGKDYAVYRSEKGVYVHFSDVSADEARQRSQFTAISPELCELRYLTYEMRSNPIRRHNERHPSSLYEHNMAQAVMLVMEGKVDQGKELAGQALKMAITRVTNDNTAKYFGWCVGFWLAVVLVFELISLLLSPSSQLLIYAAMTGATGALFSVATRLQAFELHPCQQSNMNYLMGLSRILIGVVSGPILFLLGSTVLKGALSGILPDPPDWQHVAVLGLIGGFTERLIPNLLTRTAQKIEDPAGTPVQATRSEQASQAGVNRPTKPADPKPETRVNGQAGAPESKPSVQSG